MESKRKEFSAQLKELAAKEDVCLEQVYIKLGDPKKDAIYSAQIYIPITGDDVRIIWHVDNKFEDEVYFRMRYDLAEKTDIDMSFKSAQKAYDFARMTGALINAAWKYDEDCLYWAFRALFGNAALIGGGRTGLSAETEKRIAEKVDVWICETEQDADDPERGYDCAVKDLTDDERRFFEVAYQWNKNCGGQLF